MTNMVSNEMKLLSMLLFFRMECRPILSLLSVTRNLIQRLFFLTRTVFRKRILIRNMSIQATGSLNMTMLIMLSLLK